MENRIENYRKRLMKKADVLIEEIEKEKKTFEENYKKSHSKPDGYVLKENLAFYNNEIEAVQNFKEWLQSLRPEDFKSIEEFRSKVLEELEKMYENLTRIRVGIRMVMETVKSTFV